MASRNRGKRKPSISELSRTPPTDEERKAVREALRDNDSPIAVAVLGASIAEFELEVELRAKFRRSDDETWKLLTSDIGPLGTFNQKIIAGFGFGILNETLKDGMHTIRRIRNAFAHTKRLIDFDNELVIGELRTVALPAATRSKLYKSLNRIRNLDDGPKDCYGRLCLIMGLQLLERGVRRAQANNSRLKARLRQKAYVDALRNRSWLGQSGLGGLLGGLPPADPRKTIVGQGLLGHLPQELAAPDSTDK